MSATNPNPLGYPSRSFRRTERPTERNAYILFKTPKLARIHDKTRSIAWVTKQTGFDTSLFYGFHLIDVTTGKMQPEVWIGPASIEWEDGDVRKYVEFVDVGITQISTDPALATLTWNIDGKPPITEDIVSLSELRERAAEDPKVASAWNWYLEGHPEDLVSLTEVRVNMTEAAKRAIDERRSPPPPATPSEEQRPIGGRAQPIPEGFRTFKTTGI